MINKTLLTAAAACMLLFACKKKESAPSPQSTVPVTFTVTSGLTSSSSTMASNRRGTVLAAAAPIPVATKYLTALFYDANSNLLQRIDQTNGTTTGFGTVTATLPTGKVFAFFIASDNNAFSIGLSTAHAESVKIMPKGYPAISFNQYSGALLPTTSIFTTSVPLNITAPLTQTVTLTRAVSQVTVTVSDIIQPSAQFTFEANNIMNRLDLLQQFGEHSASGNSLVATSVSVTSLATTADVGRSGYSSTNIVWPGTARTLTYYYAYPVNGSYSNNSKTLVSATDTLKANTRYNFEGYFTNLRQTSSTITTDTTWNPTVNKKILLKKIDLR